MYGIYTPKQSINFNKKGKITKIIQISYRTPYVNHVVSCSRNVVHRIGQSDGVEIQTRSHVSRNGAECGAVYYIVRGLIAMLLQATAIGAEASAIQETCLLV